MKSLIHFLFLLCVVSCVPFNYHESFRADNHTDDPYVHEKGYVNPKATFKDPRVRVVWKGNASSEAIIGWDSHTRRSKRIVYYDTADHGLKYKKYKFSKKYQRQTSRYIMKNTFVHLRNLKADTKYYFVIKDKSRISSRFWFKTAPNDRSQQLSLISGGDSRNNRDVRRKANKMVSKLKADAVLFGGDFTNLSLWFEWKRWFDDWQLTISKDGRITPIIPTRGNHERSNSIVHDLFNVPKSNYYSTQIGGDLLNIYTLNSEAPILGDQKKWLENDLILKGDKYKYLFAQYHKPMRPHVSSKSEGVNVYRGFARLFYNYGFDIVFESDSHTVKQTWPIRPVKSDDPKDLVQEGFIRDNESGTVYVGEGTWGAPLRISDDAKKWTRVSGMFNQFKWIFLNSNDYTLRTVKYDNVDVVKEVSNDNRFEVPDNLELWDLGFYKRKKN